MRIDIARAAELLRENDDILVLCHAHPDGDTLGGGGHVRAAGCRIRGSRDEAERLVLEQVEKALSVNE